MAKEVRRVDVGSVPGLFQIAQQVKETGEPCLLKRDDEELAMITPMTRPVSRAARRRKTGIITKDDPIWNIVGMGASEGPGDVSENKHRYLAEAYRDTHE